MAAITPQQRADCNKGGIDNPCYDCKKKNLDCKELVDKINEATDRERPPGGGGVKGLKQRRFEQMQAIRDNKNNVFKGLCPPGTTRYASHQVELLKQQQNLRNLLDSFNDPNRKPPCDNKGDIHKDAYEESEKPAPESGINQHFNSLDNSLTDGLQERMTNMALQRLMMKMNPGLGLMPPGLLDQLMQPSLSPGVI